MNETELLQLMIINAVKDGVTSAIKPLKEELLSEIAKVKSLSAKILKEQSQLNTQSSVTLNESRGFQTIGKPSIPTVFGEHQYSQPNRSLESFKQEAAPFLRADGILPDVDVPIELFLKK